ncbi:MAG TPA: FAD-dependent monooxygenase [Streptosporangiaceae bacterium]|jgi:flavin-dependent dehydrogenase
MIDVLVVGGGPVGLATAIRCAQAGLQVTVAEPRTAPIDKACGEGLMPAAVERLEAIGVYPAGLPFRGIRYLDASHRADALFRRRHGLGVRRTALHDAFTQRADQLAIPVVPVRVTDFVQHSDRVTAAGIEARYLVAADGLHSSIRRVCTLDPPPARHCRFGLRRHYRVAPWSDMVEVYWSPGAEAYVTPVAEQLVGVAILGDSRGDFDSRLAAFPALCERLAAAEPTGGVRGAGPLRQDVRHRVRANVLFVGDASGYIDALTGEGISVGLAQAAVLVECLQSGRTADYEKAWRRVSRKSRLLTTGLLWSRHNSLLAPRIVPAATYFPSLFTSIVNQVAAA